MKKWLFLAAAVIAIIAAVRVGRELSGSARISTLRDSLSVLRTSVDSCHVAVDTGEAQLQAYHQRLDSMRLRVRAFEALDVRGVPADSYDIYMTAFTTYNDSAAAWQARVDTVQARLGRCRSLTETHNTVADSLRRILHER